MDVIVCPSCGQSNRKMAKMVFCSFCYQRFPVAEAEETETQTEISEEKTEVQASEQDDGAAPEQDNETAEESERPAPPQPELLPTICPHCAQDVSPELEICPNCHKDLNESWL